MEQSLLASFIKSLEDRHMQLDINFQKTKMKFPGLEQPLRVDGIVTLSAHIREMTDAEKKASAKKNVALMTQKS